MLRSAQHLPSSGFILNVLVKLFEVIAVAHKTHFICSGLSLLSLVECADMWSAGSVVALVKTFLEDICMSRVCAAFMICTASTGL